jgi:hypothetical protein
MSARIRFVPAVLAILGLFLIVSARSDAAPQVKTLPRPAPSWLTPQLKQEIVDAGAKGVQIPADTLNTECPGFAQAGVSAAGCIVAPAGCTANFIFSDGTSYYIGTARHCVNNVGDHLIMQVDTTTLADVGTVVTKTSGDGVPGNDFSLTKLDPAVVQRWGVNPAVPLAGGPKGAYTDCAAQPVEYYGHGYGVAVSQGKLEGGLAAVWHTDGFGWEGFGAPGDSGSAVLLADGRAAGDLTHLIIFEPDYTPMDFAGTRITKIFQVIGSSIKLVNADGSTTTTGPATCDTGSPSGGVL